MFRIPHFVSLGFLFGPVMASAAPTNGNDTLLFFATSGILGEEVFTSPSGGTGVIQAGTYDLNNGFYDGLGGFDILIMGNQSDVLDERSSNQMDNVEVIIMGDGNDVVFYDQTVNLTGAGGAGNDVIVDIGNNATNDTVSGADGDDFIDAGQGNDTVLGENDDDTLFGGAGNDVVNPGRGNDYVDLGDGDDTAVFDQFRAPGLQGYNLLFVGIGYDLIQFEWGSTPYSIAPSDITVVSQVYSGDVLNTIFELGDKGTVSLFEDLGRETGELDGFLFQQEFVGRDSILGVIPSQPAAVPLPAGGILLLGGLAGLGAVRRLRRACRD